MSNEPFESARQWANHDSDTATSTRLLVSLEATEKGDETALAGVTAVMSGPLKLGTAGLHGEIGPGESRTNLAVVIRATVGLAAYLKTRTGRTPRAAVGRNARYGSADFVRTAARVPSAAGCHTLVLPVKNPTPLTPLAVRALDADVGIMMTASHSPAKDNGCRVYLGGTVVPDVGQGAQIVPPHDTQATGAIVTCPPADEVPQDTFNIEDVDLRDDYVTAVTVPTRGSTGEKVVPKITLTATYDAGDILTKRALTEAGFTQVDLVAQQTEPDPGFPTASLPNPEEPGAFDLAMEGAQRNAPDPIIATDPDADCCVLAIPNPNAEKGWHQLSGDEIDSFLGEYIVQNASAGSISANSVVSLRLLERITNEHGLGYQHTLTGFERIAYTLGIHFSYEEVTGFYSDPDQARDKDGTSTSVVASSLFAGLKAKGSSGQEELDHMACTYGCYLIMSLTFRVDNLGLITEGMDRLRSNPSKGLAGSPVTEATGLSKGRGGLPGTNAIAVLTKANDRVIARLSGTRPKLKCYPRAILPTEDGTKVPWEAAYGRLTLIKAEFTKAIDI